MEIRPDSYMPAWDIDGDGRVEIVCFRRIGNRIHLCVVEGATGRIKNATPAPAPFSPHGETHCSIIPAQLQTTSNKWALLLHRDYFKVDVFDSSLKPLFSIEPPNLGHTTLTFDADGDGREEIFTGVACYDADGRVRWKNPGLLDGTGETHPDSFLIADIDGDGSAELILATGGQVCDLQGRVKWRISEKVHHTQAVRLMRTGKPDAQCRLLFNDLPVYESSRRTIWRGREQPCVDAVGHFVTPSGEIVASVKGRHTGQVGDWDGDGRDEFFFLSADGLCVNIFDIDGGLVAELPVQERNYIGDMVVLNVLGGTTSEFIYHEFRPDEDSCRIAIYENALGRKPEKHRDSVERAMASYTPY